MALYQTALFLLKWVLLGQICLGPSIFSIFYCLSPTPRKNGIFQFINIHTHQIFLKALKYIEGRRKGRQSLYIYIYIYTRLHRLSSRHFSDFCPHAKYYF